MLCEYWKRNLRFKTVALTQVQRQTRKDYRDAMEELRRDPERGFAKLDAMGAVREVAFADRATAIADAYAASVGQTLVVCATHDEIDRVTEAIRERKKTFGQLCECRNVSRHMSLNWTTCQGRSESFPPRRRKRGPLFSFLGCFPMTLGAAGAEPCDPLAAARLGRSGSRLQSWSSSWRAGLAGYCGPGSFFFRLFLSRKLSPFISRM